MYQTIDPSDLVDEKQACAILGVGDPISHATFRRGIRSGKYPKAIKITASRARWSIEELNEALAKMKRDR